MTRCPALRGLLLVLAAALCWLGVSAPTLGAQSFDASSLNQPEDLAAIWLIHTGDDPSYAEPALDDSAWTRYDSRASVKTILGGSRPDVVWYRLHVKVAPSQTGLALAEISLASAFEVYVNGQKIMGNGRVSPFAPYTYGARLVERIPDRMIQTGSLVIALRVHISRTEWDDGDPGFYAPNLSFGQENALLDHRWVSVLGQGGVSWMLQGFGFGLGIVALALFAAQRRQWEYLWIFLQFFANISVLPLSVYELFHNVPAGVEMLRQPVNLLSLLVQVLMYFSLLRLRFGLWIRVAFGAAALGILLSVIGQANGSISKIAALSALLPLIFLLAGVIPILFIVHMLRGNREAGILLIPVILSSLALYAQVLIFVLAQFPALVETAGRMNTLLFSYPAGPFVLSLNQLGTLLYILSLAIIIVLRSTRLSRQQAVLEGEVAAAREVQQVILPEKFEPISGFAIESVYQPSQQVGGDFFQILPDDEGGLLVVVGDVAGKGLPAAMLVSVLVGAIRTVAQYSFAPEVVLASLNDRLIGRTQGVFSTALAAHIRRDGTVSIANAGHLPPYLDGEETDLPGALPLGVVAGARYETTGLWLNPGSRLTFYSDGVVEAQNGAGELFGFERGRQISTLPAAEIVEAAQQFGQSDDITVVAIERDPAVANAA